MPCIILKNVPYAFVVELQTPETDAMDVFLTQNVYARIAEAAGCQTEDVKILVSNEGYHLLSNLGKLVDCPNIHGFVVWLGKEQRDSKVKQEIADTLQYYLNQHGIGKGFDLTFLDMPAGSFFLEKDGQSVMISGGEPTPPFSRLLYTIFDATGWSPPGFDPDDVVLFE